MGRSSAFHGEMQLEWQCWDLHGTEPLDFGDSGRGSIPQEAGKEESENHTNPFF